MTDKISLHQYGHSFQAKLIASLLTDRQFLEQIRDILESSYFESEANKWLVSEIKKYFSTYKKLPTLEALKIILDSEANDILKVSVVEDLKNAYKHFEATDLEFVQEKALDFCKNQKIKDAIIQSVDLLESGNYESIKKLVDEALKAGSERDIGHIYMEQFEERYEESSRKTVETPWEIINDLTDGGLGPGELGVVVAPAGIGKSWVLSSIGSGAIKNGKKVVHYTLELNDAYVGLRYDSVFSGYASQNLKFHKDDVKDKLEELDGDLVIKYYPTKTASVQTLGAHLQRMFTLGNEVDLVILDYADLLRDTNKFTKEVRHALGNIYEDLRGLAGEYNIPVWTASQANRSALDEDVIEAQKIAESYAKIMTADFVMSLSRKVGDKIANTGRFHVIKNRFGPDGVTFPAKVNTNNGSIDIYEGNTIDGKEQQGKMDNQDEYVRKQLAQKYQDLG
tara:strand:- start:792 stop:2147 length:1356 start_codon:yes stop_codon:yes gene_type:complete